MCIRDRPKLEQIESDFASMGPYVLPNLILDLLPEVTKGSNGEINLTDAINPVSYTHLDVYKRQWKD